MSDDVTPTPGGFPSTHEWGEVRGHSDHGGAEYAELIDALREYLDRVAGALPDAATILRMSGTLREFSDTLSTMAVRERDQVFGHRLDLVGRGHVMLPPYETLEGDEQSVRGLVRFGRFYLGGNGAVHGGAIPLLFDEVLGRLATAGGRSPARTAFLHVNYRSITPIDTDLQVEARVTREEGRKLFITGELHNGRTLCADADALFVQLRPGQP